MVARLLYQYYTPFLIVDLEYQFFSRFWTLDPPRALGSTALTN